VTAGRVSGLGRLRCEGEGGFNEALHARRGLGSSIFHPSAPWFNLSGLLCRRANDYLCGRNDHFQALSHMAKIFCREKQSLGSNYYAVFRFHGRIDVGLTTSIFFTRPKAPRSITNGVESSCRSRSVKSWMDQNSSSCSQETNLGMARNFFPILLSLLGSQVHGGHQKIASSSMELQNDFEKPVGERRTHDDNSNGVLLVPQPDRPTMRQCFLYFVPRDSMLFPYFPFNEGFNAKYSSTLIGVIPLSQHRLLCPRPLPLFHGRHS
jgi:hypothetical protein